MKKTITEEILNWDQVWDAEGVDYTPEYFIKNARKAIKEAKFKGYENFRFERVGSIGWRSLDLYIVADREETDDEYNKRLAKNQKAKARRAAKKN